MTGPRRVVIMQNSIKIRVRYENSSPQSQQESVRVLSLRSALKTILTFDLSLGSRRVCENEVSAVLLPPTTPSCDTPCTSGRNTHLGLEADGHLPAL